MKDIPNWQLLVFLYAVLVAVPVYIVHIKLRDRAYANRTFINLLIYFVGILGSAIILHTICMWLYFTFFFTVKT
jgi:hypothetical protein